MCSGGLSRALSPAPCPRPCQVDNPSRWVAHPVTLILPAPASLLTTTAMAAAKLEKQRRPALALQLAVWQRRPAGMGGLDFCSMCCTGRAHSFTGLAWRLCNGWGGHCHAVGPLTL